MGRGGRQAAAAFARPHQTAQAATSLAIVGWTGRQWIQGWGNAMAREEGGRATSAVLAVTLDTAAPDAMTALTASIFAL